MMINVERKLNEIWASYHDNCTDPKNIIPVLDRGFVYSKKMEGEILITGINPSWNEKQKEPRIFGFDFPPPDEKKHGYYTKLLNVVKRACPKTPLCYTDLFYFRENNQRFINKFLKDNPHGVIFLTKQLELTQLRIEGAKSKLILVFNQGTHDFWGKNAKQNETNNSYSNVWMGYEFDRKITVGQGGELCRITGMVNSTDPVSKSIINTNLTGTFVYFSKYLGRINRTTMDEITDEIRKIMNGVIK